MVALKHLWLRQNKITEIPVCVAELKNTLVTLSLSSNLISELPEVVSELAVLKKLYVNGNKIEKVHASFASCGALEEVTLSNNTMSTVPTAWTDRWGSYDPTTGHLKHTDDADAKVVVKLFGNPIA